MQGLDRQFWLALLLAGAIIVPRSILICRAQSEGFDDEYHLARGLAFCQRNLGPARLNDPPLGAAISAVPLWVTGCYIPDDGHVLYHQKFSTQTLLVMIGVWKSLLFLPLVGGVFVLLRELYGLQAAWGGALLLAVEPNFAAFIPNPGLDVVATEGIFFACWSAWRYFERPTITLLVVTCAATAFAMLLKHTAVVVPLIIVVYAIAHLVRCKFFSEPGRIDPDAKKSRDLRASDQDHAALLDPDRCGPALKRFLGHAALGSIVFLFALWALLLFDVSKPAGPKDPAVLNNFERSLLSCRLPAGNYIGSILNARAHVSRGHPAFLLGQRSLHGWWYYFPVVATFKVPIGAALMMLAALASLRFVRPKWDDAMMAIALVVASAFYMKSGISIGFRHFLPGYLFLLMLAARCFAPAAAMWRSIGWLGVGMTAVHGAAFHPNYIAYTNFPRQHIWLKISDSNLEWGQSLRQVGDWIRARPELSARPIHVAHYLAERGPHAMQYLPASVNVLHSENPMPTSGILIIDPTWLVSAYQQGDRYSDLRLREPIDTIAGSMLVYDLDRPIDHPIVKTPATKKRRPSRAAVPRSM